LFVEEKEEKERFAKEKLEKNSHEAAP